MALNPGYGAAIKTAHRGAEVMRTECQTPFRIVAGSR
jgi:hypothetical protein